MPQVRANGLTLDYESIGPDSSPPVILIMGLGMQMIAWPDSFCQMLVTKGFRVIRFDNRDCGLSTKIEQAGQVDVAAAWMRMMTGQAVLSPYRLDDMALDTVGLMDGLGIKSAHIVGASMGGMIAQILAARHGERVRSLTSIMSTSGDPHLPSGRPDAVQALTAPRPTDGGREALVMFMINMLRILGSKTYPAPESELRDKVERGIDRANYPIGIGRQMLAIMASGSRAELLKTVRVPSLVIHGDEDPLVPVAAGRDTAARIPGARFELVQGMGHDVPAALIPLLVEMIAAHAIAAEVGR